MIKLLSKNEEFETEFRRCCYSYEQLVMFSAWIGSKDFNVPYTFLDNLKSVEAYIGVSFNHSSPDGIRYFLDKKFKITVVDSLSTYHPKLYFFKGKKGQALLMGSSNFTYSGFYENTESNLFIEGNSHYKLISDYLNRIYMQVKSLNCFIPDDNWLKKYDEKYKARQKSIRKSKQTDESIFEDDLLSNVSWLGKADWVTYFIHLKKGLVRHQKHFNHSLDSKLYEFREYENWLKPPWSVSTLNTIEIRRMISGIGIYGFLGHVGASGNFQRILANGTAHEKSVLVNGINSLTQLQLPLDYEFIRVELNKLQKIGPTVKVWGRLLAIVRPDLYCTISSEPVRSGLSKTLGKPKKFFTTIEGYIELLKLIHQSPWFNSKKPKDHIELEIWKRRVAFLDVVFYK